MNVSNRLINIGLAAIAVSAFAMAMSVSNAERPTEAIQKMYTACEKTPFSKAALKNMGHALDVEANALSKLGLGSTKTDVCHALAEMDGAHADTVSAAQFSDIAGRTKYVFGMAILHQIQDPAAVPVGASKLLAEAFDVPPQEFAKWTQADFTKKIGGYGIKHVREQMVLDGMVDGINPETVENPTFREFVTTTQEAHM